MKNVLKIFGFIALAAVIGFPLVSCDDGVVEITGGVLTVTSLGSYDNKYIVAWDNNDTLVALSVNKQNGVLVKNGSATLSVWNVGTNGIPTTAYKGSDTMLIKVIISDTDSVNFADGSDGGDGGWVIAKFTNGVGGGLFTDKLTDKIDNIPDLKNGILTLTGLEQYNGSYVAAMGSNETIQLVAAKNINTEMTGGKGVKISNGKAVLNVWGLTGDDTNGYTVTPYKGTDTVSFEVGIFNKASVTFGEDSDKGGKALATFKSGIGAGYFGFDIEDPGEQTPPSGGGTSGTSIDITVPQALVGSWTGDGTNGTLTFAGTKISTTDAVTTKAYSFITAIKRANTETNTITITSTTNSAGTITKTVEGFATINLYSWKIDNGTTLTITDNIYGTTAFTGTKQ